MKILLINPSWGRTPAGARRYRRAWPPLDLLVAAAWLRQAGHQVSLVDARASGAKLEDIRVEADRADLILLQSTPLDRWQCPDLNWRYLCELARFLAAGRLVLAGVHGTLRPALLLRETGAAAVIRGEPERSMYELAAAGGDPRGLAGLSYLAGDRVIHEKDRDRSELDALPAPAYDLINPDDYAYELLGSRLALLETSRGCPYTCTFCLKAMSGSGYRTKSLARVISEIETVVGQWGARHIYFMDLEFTLVRERTLALCRELVKMKAAFHWCCQTRVDTVDPELLAWMKAAGCRLVHFGIESGTARLLDATRKKTTLDQARQAVAWCRRQGLATACFFLFGLPGETGRDRRAALTLAKALNPTYASFHVAAPYPGTDLNRLTDSRTPFPLCLSEEHDLKILARSARRAYLAFYLRPGYILARLREGSLRDHLQTLTLFKEFVR